MVRFGYLCGKYMVIKDTMIRRQMRYHTAYQYDGRGLLQDIFYGDGSSVSYHYDALGRLEEARDAAGATKIVSDALGRVVSVIGPDGKTVGYEWGSMGERRRLTYPDGREALYGYNEKGQLSSLSTGRGAITYTYDQLGHLKEKTFPNGTAAEYAYTAAGQLERIRHTGKGIGEEYLYHYDKAGNKTGAEKKRQGMEADSGLFGYRYDALNRLTEVSRDGQLLRKYAYDAFGNRTLKEDYSSGEPVQTTYRYNGANQLIFHVEEEGRQDYAYDRRGNLTAVSRGEERLKAFTFDAANRMDSALQIKGGTERRAEYRYDAFGNRAGQTVYSGATGSGIHGIPDMGIQEPKDPEKQISYTIDLTRQYRNVLAAEDNAGQKAQTFYWDGNVAAMEEAGQDSYYLQDDLGSPMHLLDGDGEVRESYGFDEFGQALFPYEERQAQPFGYTGYQMEEAGGLYFAQARRYDAGAGRFVSEDVVKGHMASPYMLNSYTYCWNRPLEHVDLDGRIPEEIVGEENSDYVAAVYLVNESGALGQGHAALLLMQDNGNAEFYSYAGKVTPKAFTLGSEGYLSTHVDSFGVPSTISIEDFINNSGAYADNVYNKGVNLSEIDSYTNGVYIPISNDEGIAMHNMAMEIRSEPGKYNLWNHNCGQVAQIILQAGEKDFAKTTFAWWDTRPNSVYDNIVEEIEKGDRPGWRYGSIGELMLLDNNNDNCIDGE